MKLLDLFCGAMGAGVGYARAGFDVTGVDIEPHADAPHPVIVADALEVLTDQDFLASFDVVHASPPCQAYTTMSNRWRGAGGKADDHVKLIVAVREALAAWGGAYVIENVPGARADLIDPITLRGGMFDLRVDRPRLFESNVPLTAPSRKKVADPLGVYGKSPDGRRLFTRKDGSIQRAARGLAEGQAAMGIDWMTWDDLREAIPPAYTEHLGHQLVAHLRPCTLILHSTFGICPSCSERVLAPAWNQNVRHDCYWCGFEGAIPCSSGCGCIRPADQGAVA